jgi:ribose transport system permease protein
MSPLAKPSQQPAADPQIEDSGNGADRTDFRQSLRRLVTRTPWILWVLIVICGVFTALAPHSFLTVQNGRNVALDVSILLVMAVGTTFVLVAGGIDLSIGSVLVLSGVISARLLREIPLDGWEGVFVALGAALACGALCGLFNGIVIAYARVNALITTLGTLGMAQGLAYVLAASGLDIPVTNPKMAEIGIVRLFGQIPILVIVAAVVATVGGIALAQTKFGRHSAAIGSNSEAADRVGIDVRRHLVKIYLLSGTLSGLAGFLSLVRFSTTTIQGHALDVLSVITGVILGGTSLFGGIATMFGTVIGLFIPAVLANGLIILRVVPFWQQIAVGAILIIAVYVDQLKRSRR